eukprot:TRINITY_DN10089_c0_g1_i3.p1 TRINITY_DN10089_c0_g1~~TRINITY_DN10089_c0_g1_i3.p1  ORF type:complete len:1064 (-),score=284.62 TRINITY_DN10089_c0_g1_i3:2117-5308(-)
MMERRRKSSTSLLRKSVTSLEKEGLMVQFSKIKNRESLVVKSEADKDNDMDTAHEEDSQSSKPDQLSEESKAHRKMEKKFSLKKKVPLAGHAAPSPPAMDLSESHPAQLSASPPKGKRSSKRFEHEKPKMKCDRNSLKFDVGTNININLKTLDRKPSDKSLKSSERDSVVELNSKIQSQSSPLIQTKIIASVSSESVPRVNTEKLKNRLIRKIDQDVIENEVLESPVKDAVKTPKRVKTRSKKTMKYLAKHQTGNERRSQVIYDLIKDDDWVHQNNSNSLSSSNKITTKSRTFNKGTSAYGTHGRVTLLLPEITDLTTLNAIIEDVVNDPTSTRSAIFFLTYPLICTALELLEKLYEKFESLEEDPKRQGCFMGLWFWVEHFDIPHLKENEMKSLLDKFLTLAEERLPELAKQVSELKHFIERNPEHDSNPVSLSVSQKIMISPKFMNYEPQDIALQLTSIESKLFNSIAPWELLNQAWINPDNAPNVVKFANHFNEISSWVKYEILIEEDQKKRAKRIEKFIEIAEFLKQLNNLNGVFEISSALESIAVSRLKNTFELISNYKSWQKSNEFIQQPGKLRETMNLLEPPFIPYIGLLLNELTQIHEGNSSNEDGKINFIKNRIIAKTLGKVMFAQSQSYKITLIPSFQDWIEERVKFSMKLTDEDFYSFSAYHEPKAGTPQPEKPVFLQKLHSKKETKKIVVPPNLFVIWIGEEKKTLPFTPTAILKPILQKVCEKKNKLLEDYEIKDDSSNLITLLEQTMETIPNRILFLVPVKEDHSLLTTTQHSTPLTKDLLSKLSPQTSLHRFDSHSHQLTLSEFCSEVVLPSPSSNSDSGPATPPSSFSLTGPHCISSSRTGPILHLRCLVAIPLSDNTTMDVNGQTHFRTCGSFPGNLSLSINGSLQVVGTEAKTPKKEFDGTESTHDTESEDTEMTPSAKRLNPHRWVSVPRNRLSLPIPPDFEKDILKNSKRIPRDSHSQNNSPECSMKAQELDAKGMDTSNPNGREEEICEDVATTTMVNIRKDRLKAKVLELSTLIDKLTEGEGDKWSTIEDEVGALLKKLEK